jgi:hypothetical protein
MLLAALDVIGDEAEMNKSSEITAANHMQEKPAGDPLERLSSRRREIYIKYRDALATRTQWTLIGLFLSILAPIVTVSLARAAGSEFNFLRGLYGRDLTMFEVTLNIFLYFAFAMLLIWFYYHYAARRLKRELLDIDAEIEEAYLLSPSQRLKYFQKQYFQLTSRSITIKWFDAKSRDPSDELRLNIGNMLVALEAAKNRGKLQQIEPRQMLPEWDNIQTGLAQWDELLQDEERELIDQKNWKLGSIGIALLYLSLLIAAIPFFDTVKNIFGVPFPILFWSAVGSFAAILYRFYKSPRRINLEIEIRWLFARPLIGIVMGILAYLALVAGLFIFGSAPSETAPDTQPSLGTLAQFWIVAFLAGFSDKFYEKVIEWLVGKFGAGSENESESYVEETKSKVLVTTQTSEK